MTDLTFYDPNIDGVRHYTQDDIDCREILAMCFWKLRRAADEAAAELPPSVVAVLNEVPQRGERWREREVPITLEGLAGPWMG